MIQKPFLRTMGGEVLDRVPFWFMRQAGRYLPEYREFRQKAGGFLNLVYEPEMATEITLQPLRRFGMDAAILFSDILVVPHALGQALEFVAGEGPKLDPIIDVEQITQLKVEQAEVVYGKVYAAIEEIRMGMEREGFNQTTLIGFAGAPWTVACYMVQGGGSKDFQAPREWAYRDPDGFGMLIDLLVETTSEYLIGQVRAGVETLQIFDSWAGCLDAHQFHRWVIQPTKTIIDNIRNEYPEIPVIGFPKGAGVSYRDYVRDTGVTAVSIDYSVSTSWAASALQSQVPVQGNLDPVCLLAGGDELKRAIDKIFNDLGHGPLIFNLGHGIAKETPVEHVEALVSHIQDFRR